MPSIATVLKVCLTLCTLAYLSLKVDFAAAILQFRQSDPSILATGTLVLASLPILGSLRWHMIRRALDVPSHLRAVTRWTYISVFFSQVLPATVGGDALRIWLANREDRSLKAATNSVSLDRVVMLLTLVLLTAAAIPGFGGVFSTGPLHYVLPLLLVAGAVCFLALLNGDRLAQKWQHLRAARAVGYLALDARKLFLAPKLCGMAFALSLLTYIVIILSVYLFAVSFGAAADPRTFFVLIPPVLVAATLPISFGGWGTRELAMIAALGTVGINPQTALLASLWLGIGSIIVALPGAAMCLFGDGTINSSSIKHAVAP